MSQPVIKYTLTKQGRQPDWLSKHADSFKGEHSTSANKAGKLPRFGSPQDTIYLGIGAGDPDDDGTPDGYVGIITTKAELQTYITEVGTAAGYKTITDTLVGVQTSVTVGLTTAWESGVGLTTTTTDKVTYTGVGTVVTITGSQVTKVVTETSDSEGYTTVDTPIVVDPASTLTITGVTTSVGVTTVGDVTTTTTTTTSEYSYTDAYTSTSTSKSETTTDGVTTRTDTVTTNEYEKYETSYDYAAEATRLWDKYEAVNA